MFIYTNGFIQSHRICKITICNREHTPDTQINFIDYIVSNLYASRSGRPTIHNVMLACIIVLRLSIYFMFRVTRWYHLVLILFYLLASYMYVSVTFLSRIGCSRKTGEIMVENCKTHFVKMVRSMVE